MANYNKKVTNEYVAIIKKVMRDVYLNNPRPRMVDYEEYVAEYKSRQIKAFSTTPPYTKRSVHTPVRRALIQLEEESEIIRIGKYYYPAVMHTFRESLEDFKKNVRLSKGIIAAITPTTYALALEPNQDIDLVKTIVKSTLREKNVFSLIFVDNTLVIIFNEMIDNSYFFEFQELIRRTYEYQHSQEV